MENLEKCTVAMLEGPCLQHVTGNTSWLNQPQSAIMLGLIYGGVPWGMQQRLDWGDWVDLWGYVTGAHDWIGEMGLICGGTPLGCDTGWMWVMRLIYGGVPWGRTTGSGWWN